MKLIIDFDALEDDNKKKWLLQTLKLMGIGFEVFEKSQTNAQYNEDLIAGDTQIQQRNFITAEDLKIEAQQW